MRSLSERHHCVERQFLLPKTKMRQCRELYPTLDELYFALELAFRLKAFSGCQSLQTRIHARKFAERTFSGRLDVLLLRKFVQTQPVIVLSFQCSVVSFLSLGHRNAQWSGCTHAVLDRVFHTSFIAFLLYKHFDIVTTL